MNYGIRDTDDWASVGAWGYLPGGFVGDGSGWVSG